MNKILSTVVFGVCLLGAATAFAVPDGDMAPNDKQLAALYWQGHESLKASDWSTARERFRRLESELRKKEPASADAAVYWQAYALLKANRTAEARATLEDFQRDFPDSRWKNDADALLRQTRPATEVASGASVGSDDLAEIAVSGLMQAPPERALPILRKVLNGTHSITVKKRALFVLSQLDEDAALETLGEVAARSTDAQLRGEAIRMLGISGENKAVERLQAIYASSKSDEDKHGIIQAWLIADRPDLVLQSARNESDEELRKTAIQTLGAMEATKELHALFESEKSMANREAIVHSLGVAGDAATLASIAASNEPEELRIHAIRAIGIADDESSGAALIRIYASASSPGIREAALQGLMISDNSAAMLTLYRQAKSNEEKQALLRMLTLTDSDATLDLIEAELDNGSKQP